MRKFLMFLLTAAMFLGVFGYTGTVYASGMATSGKCGDNLTWSVSGETLTITGTGEMYDYCKIKKYWVDGIEFDGYAPWYDDSDDYEYVIRKVVLPDGLTSIGAGAFAGLYELSAITIPQSVTKIGNCAFNGCESLENISIPSGVTSIGIGAFSGSGLTSITLPSKITKIEKYLFEGCNSLKTIKLPSGIKTISSDAFAGCKISNITIPKNVKSIGNAAFAGCWKLAKITIPSNVTSIGKFAFTDCKKLKKITVLSKKLKIGSNAFGSMYADSLGTSGVICIKKINFYGKSSVLKKYVTSANKKYKVKWKYHSL